ncbi:MAG: class II glutamine amidotransferase [bacterium]|nr:class II glutamine amidotransferase [bacterium]
MCRYAAYLGPPLPLSELIYKPANSLVHQATDASLSRTRINADGFGVGWYSPEISSEPAVFKDTSPVWNNYNLGEIAGKVRSPCIVAHVRSAKSYDPVNRENCHPFRRGRLLWMHNGDIPGRARLTRQVSLLADDALLAQVRGNTDTEQAFTLFLTHLEWAQDCDPTTDQLARALEETLSQIVAWHLEAKDSRPLELNFCVTTGKALVASRFALAADSCPTLYWRSLTEESAGDSVVVASEPLSDLDGWSAVENGQILLVHPGLLVETRPLSFSTEARQESALA